MSDGSDDDSQLVLAKTTQQEILTFVCFFIIETASCRKNTDLFHFKSNTPNLLFF